MTPELGSTEALSLVEALRDFNSQSEGAFLEMGEVLGSLAGGARTLAQCAAEMAGSGGAEGFGESVKGLEDLVAELERIRRESDGRGESLARMAVLARGFRRPAREFARANRTFRLLGLYMRVEASRLKEAEADFQALSDDIRGLAAGIDECAEDLEEKARRSSEELEAGRQRINALYLTQAAESRQMLDLAGEELAAAQAGRQQSEETARRLAQGCADVRDEINRLVTSLQFQDIARQRLEHVGEGLQRLGEVLQGPQEGAGAAELAALQWQQLRSTRRELGGVLERIAANLSQARQRLGQLRIEVARLVGEAPDWTERRERIQREARLCVESTERLRGVVQEVAPTLQGMSVSANHIDEIGYRIGLVSLNCAIKTERLGGKGAALGVVACELSRLALETEAHAETVAAQLGELKLETAALTDLSDGIGAVDLELRTSRTVSEAQAADTEYQQRLRRVCEVTEGLLAQLESAVARRGWADELLGGLDAAEHRLGQLTNELGGGPAIEHGAGREWSEDLLSRYTMASERGVHQEYLLGYQEAPDGEGKEKDEIFGGEVELF
jgi:methyl-accepting chemotaxis protein